MSLFPAINLIAGCFFAFAASAPFLAIAFAIKWLMLRGIKGITRELAAETALRSTAITLALIVLAAMAFGALCEAVSLDDDWFLLALVAIGAAGIVIQAILDARLIRPSLGRPLREREWILLAEMTLLSIWIAPVGILLFSIFRSIASSQAGAIA